MPDPKWLKSSYSEASANNCVEVAVGGQGLVALRDSTRPSLAIPVSGSTFHALVQGVKTGGFTSARG
ncbi:DUF397 domain-containing protein [Streptomyces sp. NPDC020330]|uniref:DUF397 domain-containing protein n=1 Tax=unclassified Streptomyces TaxID=2593676 RepID=UPI00378CA2F1